MNSRNQIAVMGAYRSGSSVIAGMLDRLGVDMGAPYHLDYYEPADLSTSLRRWWSEPELVAAESSANRVYLLRQWLDSRGNKPWIGCKHPLLCLSAQDILRAWGPTTKFIWCNRRLEDSIASLERLNWRPNARAVQERLYAAAEAFFPRENGLIINYEDTLAKPDLVIDRLVEFLQIAPPDEQRSAARHLVRVPEDIAQSAVPVQVPEQGVSVSGGIVATMLCGNNERVVGPAAHSVIDMVDGLLLIDTGSTDRSLEIVSQIAGSKLVVRKVEWKNDFAYARNMALQYATELGAQWALTVDTDERIDFGGLKTLSQLREKLSSNERAQAWMVDSSSGSYEKERFVKLPSELRWQGRTHEALCGTREDGRPKLDGVRFREEGKSAEEFRFKLERDLSILREELMTNPNAGRSWYYLGQTLLGLKQFEGAIAAFDRCASIRAWDELAAWACYRAAKCLADARRFEEAIERCAIGLAIDPKYPELAWMNAWCCLQLNMFKRAIAWAQMAASIGAPSNKEALRDRIGFRDLIGWYEGPFEVLCVAYQRLGDSTSSMVAQQNLATARAMRLSAFPSQA